MLSRSLSSIAFDPQWGRQMRFITGPRQTGKTTIARQQLKQQGSVELYYLWDLRDVRHRYRKNQLFFLEDRAPHKGPLPWVCFDELHKIPKWKNALKAIFDTVGEQYRFIVTGSAKLDLFRKAGDSLSGRYFSFHLNPLLLCETSGRAPEITAPVSASHWVRERLENAPQPDAFSALLHYGGFPEPFLKQSDTFYAKWSSDYLDTVIREDIGALTRIIDRDYLVDLYRLLPERVGSPLSVSSLAGDLELSHPTLKNHLRRLTDFYLTIRIAPYSKNIKRALLKAPKVYLFDWAQHTEESRRFENFIAIQLYGLLSLWSDASGKPFRLFYVRNRQKEETDFLILKEGKPWMLLEAKLSDGPIDTQHVKMQRALGDIPLVQVCQQEGIATTSTLNSWRISASRLFSYG